MTNEDKKLICDYMDSIGWRTSSDGTVFYCAKIGRGIRFDLNDAALCVQEMQKRGDVGSFIQFSWGLKTIYPERRNSLLEYIPYIFNAENFFAAMAAYLKEGKK